MSGKLREEEEDVDTARSERTLNQRHRRLRERGEGEHRASSEGLKRAGGRNVIGIGQLCS